MQYVIEIDGQSKPACVAETATFLLSDWGFWGVHPPHITLTHAIVDMLRRALLLHRRG
jgi:hypothetical protein